LIKALRFTVIVKATKAVCSLGAHCDQIGDVSTLRSLVMRCKVEQVWTPMAEWGGAELGVGWGAGVSPYASSGKAYHEKTHIAAPIQQPVAPIS